MKSTTVPVLGRISLMPLVGLALLACANAAPRTNDESTTTDSTALSASDSALTSDSLSESGNSTDDEQVSDELDDLELEEILGAKCDPSRSVSSDGRALVVQDPEVLSRFSLKRVLEQLSATAEADSTPEAILQKLFDSENNITNGVFGDIWHCDDAVNPAFQKLPATYCPRAEGSLATSTGLFEPGHADFFEPIALINRFDLTPNNLTTCGRYHILFGKSSGIDDPNNRVFLSFEFVLLNQRRSIKGCRATAELWASLDTQADPTRRADLLESFFFVGFDDKKPGIHAQHIGLGSLNCEYKTCGQLLVSQGMQEPFEFRQFRLRSRDNTMSRDILFIPTPLDHAPLPEFFDPAITNASGEAFRDHFNASLWGLVAAESADIRLTLFDSNFDMGEVAVSGAAQPNYLQRLQQSANGESFSDAIMTSLSKVENLPQCPSDDPLNAAAIVERSATQTCAGCHAPDLVLANQRKIGCGVNWPQSLGVTHFNENGERSPALAEVFLPQRARELSTYLQACDLDAITNNFEASQFVWEECFAAGTPVTMADGSERAIETIVAEDWILAYDLRQQKSVPAKVKRRMVRSHTDELIEVNHRVLATANHLFFTSHGWLSADLLDVGIHVMNLDASNHQARAIPVQQLVMRPGNVITYNLEVETYHNFFAGGLLVHDGP